MKGSELIKNLIKILLLICCVIGLFDAKYKSICAESDSFLLNGVLLSTEPTATQKGSYNYDDDNTLFKKSSSKDYAGELRINGSFLQVNDNDVTVLSNDEKDIYVLSYQLKRYGTDVLEKGWYITNDEEKEVSDIELNEKIKSGALIVEMSRDGENWISLKKETNIFDKKAASDQLTFNISPIQAQNGSYFRITVAYQLKSLDKIEKGFLGLPKKIYNYKRNVEIYEFYIKDDVTTSNTDPEKAPRREYREVIAIKSDKGYSKSEQIQLEKSDPQYDPNDVIGYFVLNGYSGNPDKNANGDYVYTKNAGDDITLWFCLNKGINSIFDLRGDGKITVADDKKTYDKDLQTEETDFHYGALFVKYTNTEGTSKIVRYYDFLRAVASPAADTRVRLYEEGEYEVTLDYEIKSGMKKFNYKLNFSFEVKNGNCMVFFRDKTTTSELANTALAKNGFTVDFAGSKNLDVSFQRSTILEGANGILAEDVRENKGVNDFDSFEKEGIYVFTIRNNSTGQVVNKTIYVGNNKYLKAMSRNVIDLETLNSYIMSGATVSNEGEIIMSDTNAQKKND